MVQLTVQDDTASKLCHHNCYKYHSETQLLTHPAKKLSLMAASQQGFCTTYTYIHYHPSSLSSQSPPLSLMIPYHCSPPPLLHLFPPALSLHNFPFHLAQPLLHPQPLFCLSLSLLPLGHYSSYSFLILDECSKDGTISLKESEQ